MNTIYKDHNYNKEIKKDSDLYQLALVTDLYQPLRHCSNFHITDEINFELNHYIGNIYAEVDGKTE